jgi:hypothetical protein
MISIRISIPDYMVVTFQNQKFVDKLAKVMRLSEIAGDCPSLNITSETVIARAEQLVRLEADRLQDKVGNHRTKKIT